MVAIVVIGFWSTYFAPLLRGTLAIPFIVHAHGLVFLGWMALMMTQVIVAASGNIRLHRRIGRWGIAYACVVIAMGLIVGPAVAIIRLETGAWTAMTPRDRCWSLLATCSRSRSGSAPPSGIAHGRRSTSD